MKRFALLLTLSTCFAVSVFAQATEQRAALTDPAIGFDAKSSPAIEARLLTIVLNGSQDSPVTNIRVAIRNTTPNFYTYVTGWATFYDASGTRCGEGLFKLDALVEKPSPDAAPSLMAIAARYVLTPAIFDCLDATPPGKGGEVQLTDALQLLLKREPIHAVVLSAKRHDIGNPVDWLKTNLLFASRDAALWKQIAPLIDELRRA